MTSGEESTHERHEGSKGHSDRGRVQIEGEIEKLLHINQPNYKLHTFFP